jgi:hypothetical protein
MKIGEIVALPGLFSQKVAKIAKNVLCRLALDFLKSGGALIDQRIHNITESSEEADVVHA